MRDKRNELSTKYNRGVNIIGVIDNCLRVTAIGLGITGVGLLSTIDAASAVIGIETVSIVMGLLRVVGNQAITKKVNEVIAKYVDTSAINLNKLIDGSSVNRPTASNAIAIQDLVKRLNGSGLKVT